MVRRFASILGFASLFVGAFPLQACSGAPGEDPSTDSTSDELRTKECGGFVLHPKQCKSGYTCVANKTNPDLPGTCEKTKYCVILCVQGEHFVQDDTGCHCEPDATPTCAEGGGTCMSGTACDNNVADHDGHCDGTPGLCSGTKVCYFPG
jgi:hypothetical protein